VVVDQKSLKVGAEQLIFTALVLPAKTQSTHQEVKKHNAALERKLQKRKVLTSAPAASHTQYGVATLESGMKRRIGR
jgi:hypothetical protein